jgi:hypothetical protein
MKANRWCRSAESALHPCRCSKRRVDERLRAPLPWLDHEGSMGWHLVLLRSHVGSCIRAVFCLRARVHPRCILRKHLRLSRLLHPARAVGVVLTHWPFSPLWPVWMQGAIAPICVFFSPHWHLATGFSPPRGGPSPGLHKFTEAIDIGKTATCFQRSKAALGS